MRHRVATQHFNRDTLHRKALLRNLVRSLVEHGQLTTTEAKAKVVKQLTDKLMTKAMSGSVAARRELHSFFGKRDVVNTMTDRIAPAFKKQTSGFVRIEKIGVRRGDNTSLARLSFATTTLEKLDTLRAPASARAARKKGTSK